MPRAGRGTEGVKAGEANGWVSVGADQGLQRPCARTSAAAAPAMRPAGLSHLMAPPGSMIQLSLQRAGQIPAALCCAHRRGLSRARARASSGALCTRPRPSRASELPGRLDPRALTRAPARGPPGAPGRRATLGQRARLRRRARPARRRRSHRSVVGGERAPERARRGHVLSTSRANAVRGRMPCQSRLGRRSRSLGAGGRTAQRRHWAGGSRSVPAPHCGSPRSGGRRAAHVCLDGTRLTIGANTASLRCFAGMVHGDVTL